MYKGKATCKILKEIRKQIAKENDIAFVTSECKYQGDCLGTCPACEAEVRYLEEELRKRKQLGKTAIVTGVSLGLATSFMGCHFGGNTEETTIETTPFETAKQENTAPSESSFETETTKPDAQKQSRHHKQSKTGGEYLEFHFGGVEEVPPKRNTRAVRKSIKSMPRWTPGKDQNCQPVRCAISGHIILEDPIQVWID